MREHWTPEQQAHRLKLLVATDRRPWWMIVCAKQGCFRASGTPIMRWDHTTWRSAFPPCGAGCQGTVWALTPAEARQHGKRRGEL